MNNNWFVRKGLFFKPASWAGWLIFVAAAAYAAYTFYDLNSRSHSVSDLMINFVFSVIIIVAVYSLIAYLSLLIKK